MQKTNRFSRLLAVLVAVFMAVCCLPLSAFAEGGTNTPASITLSFKNEKDETVGEGVMNAPSLGDHRFSEVQDQVPAGYALADPEGIFNVNTETKGITVPVIATEGTMYIYFVCGDDIVGDAHHTLALGNHNYSELAQFVPEGYQMTVSGDFMVTDGGELKVAVEKIVTEVNMNIRFMDGDTFIADGDYMLTVGTHNYSELAQYVPAGYRMTASGDFQVPADGGQLDVNVEKITDTVVMNIRFMEGDTFIAGGDYMLPAGVQNYSILEQYVPAGYKMTVTGDFQVTAGGKLDVNVEKITDTVVMNIRFMEGETFIAGGDYMLPAGVQNYSILEQYVPAGYKMTVTGDFQVTAGGKLDVNVEKITDTVVMNIRFMEGETFIAGGDYMLPAGVQNYSILEQYVPAGYKMTVTGDFQVTAGGKLDVNVEKITDTVVMNIRFMEGETFIAGGDYMLPAGVQNYSILEQYVPEGYEMDVMGDFMAAQDAKLEVPVHKIADEPEDKPEDKPGEGGGDNGSDSSTPAAGTNDNGSNAQNGQTDAQVVKADVPADNSTKIMPQTGLSAEKPVVFGAMMVTGLGSAAAYLFVLRKKLN